MIRDKIDLKNNLNLLILKNKLNFLDPLLIEITIIKKLTLYSKNCKNFYDLIKYTKLDL